MNRREHLLTIAAEECAEVAQRISKALRFGVMEIQPGQPLTNGERIGQELTDLLTVMEMVREEHPSVCDWGDSEAQAAKRAKVEKFLLYSAQCGTLGGGDRG